MFRRANYIANIRTAGLPELGTEIRISVSDLLSRTPPACYAAKVDVAIRVPDIEVYIKPGRGTAQTYFYTTHVFVWIQLQVTNVGHLNTANKLVILLLLFADSFRGP